jgi:hypothetical protein
VNRKREDARVMRVKLTIGKEDSGRVVHSTDSTGPKTSAAPLLGDRIVDARKRISCLAVTVQPGKQGT